MSLTEQQMLDAQDILNDETKTKTERVRDFYTYLESKGEDYGRLGREVTNNEGWQGQLANGFAKSGGEDNGGEYEYGSNKWTDLNFDLANRHLQAYQTNEGGTPQWDQIQQYHNEGYVFAGLDENDWFPNKMLNESSDPDALWQDWMVNESAADIWGDSWELANAGAGLLFGPEFLRQALSEQGIGSDELEFARNFMNAIDSLDNDALIDLIDDATAFSDFANIVSQVPGEFGNLMDDFAWLWAGPTYDPANEITDGAGDGTYTIEPNSGGVMDHTVFNDGGGNDTITVKNGAGATITNDGDTNSSNTVILEGLDEDDVELVRDGNDLHVINKNTGNTVLVLKSHFDPAGPGVGEIDFAPDASGNGGNGDPISFDPTTGMPEGDTPVQPSLWDWFYGGVQGIADWMQGVIDAFMDALNTGSPLVLDLDGDGIELVALADTNVYWDIDEDSFSEAIGWVAAEDGFLAIDLDSDGAITEHTELFGSVSEDGFTALSVYDTNADDVIDANDAQFADLLVWQDVNQNGISEAAELYTLAGLDIVSIDLNATQVTQTNAGHDISHVSTYTVDDGVSGPQTLDIVDVWFQYDNVNTNFAGDYTLDIASLFVTTMRGYGNMPDLHVAASMDNNTSDPASLMSLLTAFAAKDFTDLFVQDDSVLAEVRDIIFRWAGVDGVDPASRGDFVDARELGVLETIFDQIAYSGYNPGGGQGAAMSYTFDLALQAIAPRLIAQAAGAQLFEGDFYYNPITDGFEGITGLSQSALDTLLAKAQDAAQVSDKVAFWGDVVRVIDQIAGVANLSTGDASALETAITTSDSTLTTQLILDTLVWNSSAGQIISGTSADDTLDGTIGDDTIYGSYGNDVITGGIGADTLRGQAHDDTLNGQSGDDFLYGESGADTYLYFAGQGHDTITEESSGSDKVLFGPGVTFTDLTLTRISNTDLQIDLSDAVGGGAVTILNQFGNANSALVELLEFNDTSTVDLSTIVYTLTGTDGADTLKGIRYGGSQEDTIYGLDGDDTITGYFSTLDYGDNWLYGGAGADTIYGANGVDYIDGGADDDYIRGYSGNDEIHGGDGLDELLGGNHNDTLYGGDGADILKGENNDDVLTGGPGADELWGGTGYDTFTFLDGESFDAVDTIKDFNTTYDAIDISDLLSAYDPFTDVITDFVQITDNGTDSTLAVDIDGGADAFVAIALIAGKTGLTDEAALETSGLLITA